MNDTESVELNEALQGMDRSQIKQFVAGIREIWAKQDAEKEKDPPSQ
jgi:hypothetical protein